MNDMTPRKIKTGGDLRTLPDYAVLRDEMSQLTHPARPGIHWDNVEQLVLLFEKKRHCVTNRYLVYADP